MTLYSYIKAPPGYILKKPKSKRQHFRTFISLLLIGIGIASITTVVYPLVFYQLVVSPQFQRSTTLSPATQVQIPVVSKAQAQEPVFIPEMINTTLDYTNIDTWFPQASVAAGSSSNSDYTFSVPKLGIENAIVKTGEDDLKKSLIHYPGTANPGELGNPVIFGHSVLPQFFNPKNYTSIFSTLHTLGKGDEFIINYDGVEYRYVIQDMYEVEPSNLTPLAQSFDNYHLTVITCTPPGTYLRRLVIKASLT